MKQNTDTLLIGEAPGFKGGVNTGIPFTSISQLEKLKNCGLFPDTIKITHQMRKKLLKESSSTIMWEYLFKREFYPIIWNIFPFHPHKEDLLYTNRVPGSGEIEMGKKMILDLQGIFNFTNIIAVGNKAGTGIENMKIPGTPNISKVRHPSFGGKNEFISGMDNFLKKIKKPA